MDISMRQAIKEAAKDYAIGKTLFREKVLKEVDADNYALREDNCYEDFKAGAEWKANRSPWIRVEDGLPGKEEYDWVLVLLRDKRDGFIGIPKIGELREDGFWHTEMSDTFNTPSFRRTYNTTDVLGTFLNQEVIAWTPIPSFNEILESDKDVSR